MLTFLVIAIVGGSLAKAKDTADPKPAGPAESAAGPSKEDTANAEKSVKTPKPEKHPMLGQPAPKWEVGPWHQLPEGKESLDSRNSRHPDV